MLKPLRNLPENAQLVFSTALLSISAGLSAVGFMVLNGLLFRSTYLSYVTRSKAFFLVASFLTITATSLLVGLLMSRVSPEAAGSGIPELKVSYWKELGYINPKPVLVKFAAGILSIGGGASLGREGPSVFFGGGVASNLAGALGTPRRERRAAVVIGTSAGLAAAFNTPLAAITFIIEELVGDLNTRYLGRVVLSSVLGALVVYAILGRQPAFILPPVEEVSWLHYLLVPVVAVLASLSGVAFQKGTLALRIRLRKQKKIPSWLLPALGGMVVWVIASSIFLLTGRVGIFGLGYNDLSATLIHRVAWQTAALLVAAKLIATIFSYGSGSCGGIFSPTLFMGGLTGYFLGGLFSLWLPLTASDRIVLAAAGMAACLGTVVRAPLTSMLIVFEMTHQFSFVPALLIGMLISQAVARLAGRLNFYDALLVQDGHELHKIRPPLDIQSWQKLHVSAIANPQVASIRELTEQHLREMVDQYPYRSFPVIQDGKLQGIFNRQEILEALLRHEMPDIHKPVTCYADQTVREVGKKFLKSSSNILVVLRREDDSVAGVLTLHDLIRTQAGLETG
jgi:CIC family chloride channel protein